MGTPSHLVRVRVRVRIGVRARARARARVRVRWALPVTVVEADAVIFVATHCKLSAHALHAGKLAVLAALRLDARLKRVGANERCRGRRRW